MCDFLEQAYAALADYVADDLVRIMAEYREALAAVADVQAARDKVQTAAWQRVAETGSIKIRVETIHYFLKRYAGDMNRKRTAGAAIEEQMAAYERQLRRQMLFNEQLADLAARQREAPTNHRMLPVLPLGHGATQHSDIHASRNRRRTRREPTGGEEESMADRGVLGDWRACVRLLCF